MKNIVILLIIGTGFSSLFAQVQVDKFTGDVSYGLPLITIPNFRGPSVTTSISYRSDIKVDQAASEVGLGWNINAGGSVERSVNGIPDDWKNVDVPDMQSASFQKHLGSLYFHEANDPLGGNAEHPTLSPILDFDYTRYKMDTLNDTLRYYYPNYDNYYVTGAGMAGKINPENYDYKTVIVDTAIVDRKFYNLRWHYNVPIPPSTEYWTSVVDSVTIGIREIETYSFDYFSDYDYKTYFTYQHNMYDEVDSEYYPWSNSPLTEDSDLSIPDPYPGRSPYSGTGYNDENYSITANKNRTRTSNYIEYFTNAELDAGVAGFMEYDDSFNRAVEDTFPQDGIGAYRITGPNGYVYHYSLPVYAHFNTLGNAALDKYYNVVLPEGGITDITDSTNGYIVENEATTQIFEIRQTKKYAIRWLLTAITGPDYEDSNSNGMVDLEDAGYWIKYNYGLWTEEFTNRYPYYGSNYSFSSSIEEKLWPKFMDDNDSTKITGKNLSYSETSSQVYYLNEIQSPSHTGLFVRDLRNDEQSMVNNFGYSEYRSTKDLKYVDKDIVYWSGKGSFNVAAPSNLYRHYLTIKPEGVDSLELTINASGWLGVPSSVVVLDGDSTSTDTLVHYYLGCGCISENTVISTGGEITIIGFLDNSGGQISYDISWNSKWKNSLEGWPVGKPKSIPQLKLSKILLFDNADLDALPTIDEFYPEPNPTLWDFTNLNRTDIYSGDWYNNDKSIIDSLALQSVDLEQDYSLAKGYHNNRYVLINSQRKVATPVEVEDNKYIATNELALSGKLTLNKVIYYGLNKTQTQPSHLFDYNASDSTDNPEYNSLLQDYWGNYKSDADSNMLRGYVSDSSASKTDAWSLRKITSPLGGVTEIIYESDEYEQVLSEEKGGNIRGPRKTFALKNVVPIGGDVGRGWTFELENQSADFWNLKDSLPTAASMYTVIPCVWIDTTDSAYLNHYHNNNPEADIPLGFSVSYGEGNLTETGSEIDSLSFYDINYFRQWIPPLNLDSHWIWQDSEIDSLVYASNGYVQFKYPIGEKIKGGGTRVKELKVSNATDTYTIAYTYDEGTATSEAGDFSAQRKTKVDPEDLNTEDFDYEWGLTSYDYNPFGLRPQVGYGKVTTENIGQVFSGEGKSIFSYHVSDENRNNFEPYSSRLDTTWQPNGGPGTSAHESIRYGIEIIDDFTSIWGKIKAQKLEDVNGVMVSKKVYEYEKSVKGAHVSTVNYQINNPETNGYDYISCIFRTYPSYLKKVITYSNGRKSESEIIERDPFTGSPIVTKNTSINGTVSREETELTYLQTTTPDYSIMGAKSDDPTYHNFLNASYSSKTFKESSGVSNPDFVSFGKAFWKETAKTWYYDSTDDVYKTQTNAVNWYDYTKYAWTGELGDYGIFDSTLLVDITTPPTGASDWRFISEITLMDEQQNVLEQKGYNDRFSSSRLGYENRFTYTSASNANYVSFTATGFETTTEVETGVDYYEGELLSQSEIQVAADNNRSPHTGNYMVKVPVSSDGPIYKVKYNASEGIHSLQRGRTYSASVWVHKDSPIDAALVIDLVGTSGGPFTTTVSMQKNNATAIQIGDWIQLNVDIFVPEDFTTPSSSDALKVYVKGGASGDAWFDDLQFHSRVSGSGMNVYDQRTGRVLATLSDNNFATKYVYNDAGQVIEVWKEVLGETWGKWVKVESKDFNFKRAME